MSNTGKCAIKMFKDLFNQGAELYQTAQQSNQQPQQRACLRVLRAEKLRALRLMEAESNSGHDYALTEQVKEQFQSMLEHYPSIRHVGESQRKPDFADPVPVIFKLAYDYHPSSAMPGKAQS
tara:strand:+ start:331 stop:696 length:366 start_codon:yes stop_codon:yes gene_type:complete